MAHASSPGSPLGQPTIAFHDQPTVIVGPSDLARELFRGCASMTDRRTVTVTETTALRPRQAAAARSRASGTLVCIACLFLGIGAGHMVREGRAYAAALPGVESSSLPSTPTRAAHTAATLGVHPGSASRAKDTGHLAEPAAVAAARARRKAGHGGGAARAGLVSAPVVPAADALFLDFEPTFRMAF